MDRLELLKSLAIPAKTKIILLVMDGLGGLPLAAGGKTELETAHTPNLDNLAKMSVCGLMEPVGKGITPGSGPGHLALFGYDPIKYELGRGVLEALGIEFPLQLKDVACRLNFASLDDQGRITDRRAGRIPTEKCIELCNLMDGTIKIPGVQVFVKPVKDHRAVAVFRGENLRGDLADTDPQQTGVPPLPVKALTPEAQATADIANQFVAQANRILAGHHPANGLLIRGFAKYHPYPTFQDTYQLKSAAIATYPMYRGVASLTGMEVLPTGSTIADEIKTLEENFDKYDFFFMHVKKTDSCGEDGDFQGKVKVIEEVDSLIPRLLKLNPDCLAVTGDHSTPAKLKSHSWHPVPVLLYSPNVRPDSVSALGEAACISGGLGIFPTVELMGLMLANSLRLIKYGA